jgi:hypothetical protein
LPAIHGGVIAGFMELSAALHLLIFTGAPGVPKIIDFSSTTCAPGSFATPAHARCGARAAAWPTWPLPPGKARTEPIATARAHFKIEEPLKS